MKERIDKLEFITIKNFSSMKNNIKRIRRQATDWKKIFAKDTGDKELLKLNNKKTNNLIKKWAKVLKRHLTKEDI